MPYFQNAGTLIVETVFSILILFMLLRFMFQLFRADFRNPISQAIVKVTNPFLAPFRRVIPGLYGIDLAAVVLIIILGLLKMWILLALQGYQINFSAMFVLSLADTLNTVIWIFIIAVLASVIASWVARGSYHPVLGLIYSLSEPISAPFGRILPTMGGLDFSPILTLLVLQLAQGLIVHPLTDFGRSLI